MAALVTSISGLDSREEVTRKVFLGPTKVALADETNLGTPDTSIVLDTRNVQSVSVYVKFANYTSVTVKAQRDLTDGSNYHDIASATTSTTNTSFTFTPAAPLCRLSIAGTLSASADTMEVWVYMTKFAPIVS